MKTISDIINEPYLESDESLKIKSDLEEAAKEWVRELNDAMEELDSRVYWIQDWLDETSHRGDWDRDALVHWIKHFFEL